MIDLSSLIVTYKKATVENINPDTISNYNWMTFSFRSSSPMNYRLDKIESQTVNPISEFLSIK